MAAETDENSSSIAHRKALSTMSTNSSMRWPHGTSALRAIRVNVGLGVPWFSQDV